jgi:hypothetical protein
MKQQNRRMVETACTTAKKTHAKEVLLTAGMIEDHHALAIVVSEETGEVRIFHHGSIFMEIEKGG